MHLTIQLTRVMGRDVPYDHNFLLGSAVYALLKEHSVELSNAVHDSHLRSPYVLSEVHRVSGRPSEAWFRVGTTNDALVKNLCKALSPGTDIRIGTTEFKITGILMDEPVVRPGEFATLSPILLRDGESGKSLVHDTPGYKETLELAINTQIENHLGKAGSVKVIHIEPQAVRKRKIKEKTVLAQKCRMILDGDEEHLRFIVNHGIGMSPALGFGMVVLDKGWHFD